MDHMADGSLWDVASFLGGPQASCDAGFGLLSGHHPLATTQASVDGLAWLSAFDGGGDAAVRAPRRARGALWRGYMTRLTNRGSLDNSPPPARRAARWRSHRDARAGFVALIRAPVLRFTRRPWLTRPLLCSLPTPSPARRRRPRASPRRALTRLAAPRRAPTARARSPGAKSRARSCARRAAASWAAPTAATGCPTTHVRAARRDVRPIPRSDSS